MARFGLIEMNHIISQVRPDGRELPDGPPAVPLPHCRRPERAQPSILLGAAREHIHSPVGNCPLAV